MPNWSSQRYKYEGRNEGIPSDVIEAAIAVSERIRNTDSCINTQTFECANRYPV